MLTRAARQWVVTASMLALPAAGAAQGVTTAAIRGVVTAPGGTPGDARVDVRHEDTGVRTQARASGGRFLVPGLEPGGPYTVTVRSIGFAPQQRVGVMLALGEVTALRFELQPVVTQLAADTVTGERESLTPPGDGGIGTTITSEVLARLPTLNRDLYDFVRLVPQVSTKIGLSNPGLSAGGVGFRFNNFLINGVSDRTLPGGVSGAFAGARSVPLDAVKEYQVLLTPYDVRYGDFAGALVNAVTKSGTNTLSGTVFAFGRNDRLARNGAAEPGVPYDRAQYGFTLAGPIVRDRVHFLVSPELQHFSYPAAGPYVGQPELSSQPVPIAPAELEQFDAIMRRYGLTAGSAGAMENGNPQRNIFARVDVALPGWNSRLVAWHNSSSSRDASFTRAVRDTFPLSSYQVTNAAHFRTNALHLHTTIPSLGGAHNELLFSHRANGLRAIPAVEQPVVRVAVPAVSGGSITINSGTHPIAQSASGGAGSLAIRDNLTIPLGGSHVLTLGGELERFRLRRGGSAPAYGIWSFSSLRNLEEGIAERFEVRSNPASPLQILSGTQYAAYIADRWQAGSRLLLTLGLRADMLGFDQRAPYQPMVDSLFGRHTDLMPRRRAEISPRLGFVWDVSPHGVHRLRVGAGLFTGRYPLAWAQTALASHGTPEVLRCSSLGGSQFPPPFTPDHRAPPTSCSGGAPPQLGDVDLLDRDLRLMRALRGSLGYDRPLGRGVMMTSELLATRLLSDFVFVNLNLRDTVASDPNGRTMYGTLRANGTASPGGRTGFTEVIEVRNTGGNHAYQLATRVQKAGRGASGFASYTWSRVRDAQTPLRVNTRGTTAWATARATAGRHDDFTPGISSNDVPHRVIVAGSVAAPWARERTELSFYYVGESGRPFTFTSSGTQGRGDLNADGSASNDPIYVPRNAMDSLEIRITGLSDSIGADRSPGARAQRELLQRSALERLIERTPCLRAQRGRILERNSCREPWTNTTIASVRHLVPVAGRAMEAQIDVFNVLNLLHAGWGQRREAAPAVLEHVDPVANEMPGPRPVFRFNANAPDWTISPVESAFQLQLALRYRF